MAQPADVSLEADATEGKVVVYEFPLVMGGAPPLSGPSCAPASGSVFPVGATRVTCTVSDTSGRPPVERSWVITVSDRPPPLEFVSGSTETASSNGTASATISGYVVQPGDTIIISLSQANAAYRTYTTRFSTGQVFRQIAYTNPARASGIWAFGNHPGGTVTITVRANANAGFTIVASRWRGFTEGVGAAAIDALTETVATDDHRSSAIGLTSGHDTIALVAGSLNASATSTSAGAGFTALRATPTQLHQWRRCAFGCADEFGLWRSSGTDRLGASVLALLINSDVIEAPPPDPEDPTDPEPPPSPVPPPSPPPVGDIPPGSNDYFDFMRARPEAYKFWALRSQTEIDQVTTSGPRSNPRVRYDSSVDAARIAIPAWVRRTTVALPIDATTRRITLSYVGRSILHTNRDIRIDDEVMRITEPPTGVTLGTNELYVTRARFGSTAVAHQVGAVVQNSHNSLTPDQLRPRPVTQDGNTYLFFLDHLWTESWLGYPLGGYKYFQFADSKPRNANITFETRTRNDGIDAQGSYPGFSRSQHVAVIDARYYGNTNSTITDVDPVTPQSGRFLIRPNVWVRFWWFVEQHAGPDYITLWVSDKDTPPVKIFDRRMVNFYGSDGNVPSIYEWWQESDTSKYSFWGRHYDRVSLTKNWGILKNVADPTAFLRQPN